MQKKLLFIRILLVQQRRGLGPVGLLGIDQRIMEEYMAYRFK